ncbi:MAG: MASE3 domain-containing protein [Thermodesulfobacteriota bacterium]
MGKQAIISKIYIYLLGILVFLGIYLTSHYNYLLFHSLAEVFSIVIACGIFMVAWNSRQFLDNNYLLFIGIAYLFVGDLDLIHTLAYKGMGIFHGYETNLPTQLWIAARYTESLSLFLAPFFFGRKLKANIIFLGYTLVTSILLLSIFYWNIFPVCFVEGVGLTPFKKINEYIISLILLVSIVLLLKNRREFERNVLQWVVWSILLTIVSELAFTFYIDAYGLSNIIGHFFKILSFYFIYKAIIETGLTKPYNLLFRNLKQTEERFRNLFEQSPIAIELYDSDGQLLEVNQACLEIFGVSDAAEVQGFKLFDDPNLADKAKEKLKRGEPVRYEGPFDFEKVRENKLYPTTKSGTIYLDVLITPLGLEQKEAQSGYLVQVQDITDRKKMEKMLAQLASFPELNPNPIVEVDLFGSIHYLNSAAKELFPNLQTIEVQHPWLGDWDSLRAIIPKEGKVSYVREIKIGDLWYEQAISYVREGERIRIYGLDITERKQAEEALQNALEASQRRQVEISALLEASRAVLEHHEFTDAARSLFDSCKNLIGATAGYVSLASEDGTQNEALFVDSGGLLCTVNPSLPMPIRGLRGKAFCTGKTVFHNDFPNSEYINFMPEGHSNLSNVLFAPMAIKGKVVGLFGLSNKPGGFTENDARMATAFGELAAIALINKRAEEALRRSRDELEIRVQERTAELTKTTEKLAEQSSILEGFFTSTITPLVFLDRDFNFIRVNEAYAKACQRQISEFPGHNHFEFYPSGAKAIFEQVVETKMPYHAIARPFTFPDHPEWGVTYWDWTLTPLLDDKSEVEFLVFALEDVTERKRAQDALEAERRRFNDVLEMLPAYLVLLTPDYHVPFANRFFRERFGESHGRRCFEYLFGRSEPCETCETYTALKTMAPYEWEWTGPDGHNYSVFDFPFTDTDGSTLILEMGIDITERKRAEEALKVTSLYARSLIEASLDPLFTISADGKVMDVNRATELVTGVPREQLIGSDFSDYFTEPEKAKEGYKKVFSEGSVRDYPLAIRHSSDHITEVLYNATVYRNEAGEVQGVFAAARDITERKRAEEALRESENRLRSLSSQLLTVQENERKRVAREIHDGIGQMLTAIKFKVEDTIQQKGKGNTRIKEKSLETIIPLIQGSIEEVRRIQMDLRPSTLDDLGILATIDWFCREFGKIYSTIHIEKLTNIKENEAPVHIKTVIFRVMQEALNNIAKHSKADLIRLSLIKTDGKIELIIEDNGMGFDLEGLISMESSKRGFGLSSMRERTELSGGAFVIESTPGKGTIICALWPL